MEKAKIIWVKCSYILPVRVPDVDDYDEIFDIERNNCPASGRVGAMLDKIIEKFDDNGFCWGCYLSG